MMRKQKCAPKARDGMNDGDASACPRTDVVSYFLTLRRVCLVSMICGLRILFVDGDDTL